MINKLKQDREEMKKVGKKALRLLCAGAFLVMILLFIYYFSDKDYLEGDVYHYLGTSTVTEGQAVELSTELSIGGPYGEVSSLEILENGLIEADYDFYSEEGYPFLTVVEFSYFDTPLVYRLIQEKALYLSMIGGGVFILVATLLFKKYGAGKGQNLNRKLLCFFWHIAHPKYIVKAPMATGQYSPQLQVPINIDLKDQGILCVRTWKYKKGFLYSVGIGQACWETKTLLANKNPEDSNGNGVYAERLGVVSADNSDFIKDILGIVSLKGDWLEHADGVLRAERCDILHLIVGEYHRPIASRLSSVYGLPVTVVDNTINAYLDWLLKENGLASMVHNSKVMEGSSGN